MWFPLFINLENKKVLVIGGGKVALKKIKKVLEYGADVTVVTDNIKEQSILELKNSKEILINNASSKTKMNAMFGGIVKNSEFQIAISTSGKNCKRSRAMKSEIQKVLDKIEK